MRPIMSGAGLLGDAGGDCAANGARNAVIVKPRARRDTRLGIPDSIKSLEEMPAAYHGRNQF